MIRFSVLIPYYNGVRYIAETVQSVLNQSYGDYEIIIVDDCSPDWENNRFSEYPLDDPRIRFIRRKENGGTLQARKDAVLAASGDYILFLDQDDSLTPRAMSGISACLEEQPVDILHFPAKVIAESEAAQDAAAGMSSFVTPPPRSLEGSEILRYQFLEEGGFDFHIHHKAIKRSLAKAAWKNVSADNRLAMADDLYICFILDSIAGSYRAVPAPIDRVEWYEYHLGRGDTLGSHYDFLQYKRFCASDALAYNALVEYVEAVSGRIKRDDWADRLSDARDRLVSHSLNEMADNLPLELRDDAISYALEKWAPDAVAGELYRFVRDEAYSLYAAKKYPKKSDRLFKFVEQARFADRRVGLSRSSRYKEMKEAAERHLADLQGVRPFYRKRLTF